MSVAGTQWRRLALGALLVQGLCGSAGAAPAAGAQALANKRVLVVAPYAYGRPGTEAYFQTYVAGMVAGGLPRKNVAVEYLNLDRDTDTDPATRARLRALLAARYGPLPPDLLVAVQQPGLDYVLGELKDIAPGAPVIASSAAPPPAAALGARRLLLLPAYPNVRATLEQALRLFPETEEVLVMVGAAPADRKAKEEIAAVTAAMGLRARIEYTDGLSLDGMVARAARSGPRTVVLNALVNRDLRGATTAPYDMWIRVAQASAAPVFNLFSTGIGQGPLGGAVQHVERGASATVAASLDMLKGQRVLPPGTTRMHLPATSIYDWRQLARWGADPDLLPTDTVFVNRPPGLWEAHRGAASAALVAIVLLGVFSATLLVQRRQLRLAERRFRILVENAPEAIVVYDLDLGRFVDANARAEQLFGATRAQLLASGPERFYADVQPDGLPPGQTIVANAERSLAGSQQSFVRMVRALDGRCFPCEVSLVALPSASGRLLRGGFVDISERILAEEELRHYRLHLEDTVATRTAALSGALHDAESASRAKSAFLANMSHELRTPLNAIIGFSQVMAASTSMFPEEKQHLELIHTSGKQLLALINDILELSRIEAGRVQPAAGAVALPALLQEVAAALRAAAQQKGIRLLVECPALPIVDTDGERLRKVLHNLAANAVKYTVQGEVRLCAEAGPLAAAGLPVRFTVTDTGSGIAPDVLQRMFDPFEQGAAPGGQSGTGLGLTIARAFVRLLGGELEVQSTPGRGSRFSFALALAPVDSAASPADALPGAPAGAAAGASPDLHMLSPIARAQRQALRDALQQLDLQQARTLVAHLRPQHGDALASALEHMLARHQYRELCALLEHSLAADAAS